MPNTASAPGNCHFTAVGSVKETHAEECKAFSCRIEGTPRPQHRSFSKKNQGPMGTSVGMFAPSKKNQQEFQAAFKQALECTRETIFDKSSRAAVFIDVAFHFEPPKAHCHLKQVPGHPDPLLALREDLPVHVTKTPDLDNLVKLVLDALQGVCCTSDSVVAHVAARKLWNHTTKVLKTGTENKGCTHIEVCQYNN